MNRPEDIQQRIGNIGQIESIVSTLRAIAAAHQAETRTHLEAIRKQEGTVASALSAVLGTMLDVPAAGQPDAALSIVVGASQGFCGAHADRLADAAAAERAGGAQLMIIGARTLAAFGEEEPFWYADMVAHAPEVPGLASRLADALFAHLAQAPGKAVHILFADPAAPAEPPVRRRLFPFDFGRFPPERERQPLTNLAPAPLLAALVEEYVFTELCEALMLAFAAENAARAEAMARAQSNVRRMAKDLRTEFQQARQEQMTEEIIEVSGGGASAR
ncbi:F0F1 ATP synthase subunit gamma [Futiania mangrovi]|uniref:F0F1 ATP synthase subunit gamma n=1 Tax=Futiania mangrovi TaxID=2959716 RepID=A0A9J6PG29_9PROT|nr:F0F1 ATP synthase subunit gamma [Futiania mangrovii]MCP1335066.1 F0F1 ATP synthase subunit gamma [Futiania mangrovii]